MNARHAYITYVKPYLPRWIHKSAVGYWGRLLKSNFSFEIPLLSFGVRRRWRRSRDLAEIDITYACNLKCHNCNRSSTQLPTGDRMSVGQVRHFLDETRARGLRWKCLRLVGGEPTIHPQFLEIVEAIVQYRAEYSPHTIIEVTSNGYGERTKRMLTLLPSEVRVNNTAKTASRTPPSFTTFNVAPIDLPRYAREDFSKGCWITQNCGLGVTPYGYYPCAVAAGIDRVFGFNLGRKNLPSADDGMTDELRTFCALCGHFKPETREPLTAQLNSPVWQRAYEWAKSNPPQLSRLSDAPIPGIPSKGVLVQIVSCTGRSA